MQTLIVKTIPAKPMRLPINITDCGRDRAERRDCTVRALAACLEIPYSEAHARLAALGRKPKRGFKFCGENTEALGLESLPEYSCRTLAKILPELNPGRFIVRVTGHVFAVIDGTIFDLGDEPAGRRVRMVYRQTQIQNT